MKNLDESVETLQKLVVKRGTKADQAAMDQVVEWINYFRKEVRELRDSLPYDD